MLAAILSCSREEISEPDSDSAQDDTLDSGLESQHQHDGGEARRHPMERRMPTFESSDAAVDTEYLMMNPPVNSRNIKRSVHALPPTSLTFKDLSFTLGNRRTKSRSSGQTVLEPCSGHFNPGEITALMGPSGSGKTTLLDMLAMKKTAKYEGQVMVNGHPRVERLFRRIAGYVGQEDMMPAHWKVREAIRFNAFLKKSPNRAHRKIDDWIDVLLETFGINEVQDSLIGGTEVRGISGGQRRRVTLARGVAQHASLLFCDEPTSGLSATDAELCVRALQTLSKRLCVTIVVVIHQPRAEVADLFDKLVLLTSQPGRMVYFGPMDGAKAYWQERARPVPINVNPTDFFMDTVTPGTKHDCVDKLVQTFQAVQGPLINVEVEQALLVKGQTMQQMLLPNSAKDRRERSLGRYAVGFFTQLRVLLGRKLFLTLRNPMALGLPLAVPMLQGILVGYMFWETGNKPILRQVMFSFCLLTMLCLAGTMGLIVLINERTLMKHEVSEALYSEAAWAIATQLVDVPLALLGAVLNVVMMAAFAQLSMVVFQTVFTWALLLFFVYDSLFAFIGAVAKDTRQAQVLASPCVSIFMLFNGFIVTKRDAPWLLRWIFDFSPNAYAMQAIVLVQAKEYDRRPASYGGGRMLVANLGMEEGGSTSGVLILCIMIACLRVGQMLGLKFLNHIQR